MCWFKGTVWQVLSVVSERKSIDTKCGRIRVEIMDKSLAGREREGPSRALVAQQIGQHSPALSTKPEDQQGQSCFSLPPNNNQLFFNEGESTLVELFYHIWYSTFGSKPFLHSTMTVSVFSSLGFIRSLSVLLVMLTGLSLSSSIRSSENHHRASIGRDGRDNPLLDAQDFLSHFLSTLNFTEQRPQPQPQPLDARKEPPEYMLELYNRFANDRTAVPSANIVRSFKNEGTSFFIVWQCCKCVYCTKTKLTLKPQGSCLTS